MSLEQGAQLIADCRSQIALNYQGLFTQLQTIHTSLQPYFFNESIHSLSTKIIASIRTIFCTTLPELNNPEIPIAVLLTGSEGRLEKSTARSILEIIVVSYDDQLSPEVLATKNKIEQLVYEKGTKSFFDDVEEKVLSRDFVSTYNAQGAKPKSIPTRSLDAQFIAGNVNIFVAYKQKAQKELVETPKLIKEFKVDLLKSAAKVLQAEAHPTEAKKLLGVNVETGALTTNGKYTKGPKYGLLRSIQYSVALAIIQKANQISEKDFREIPATVPNRIEWLQERRFINLTPVEKNQLKGCYEQILLWYGALEQQAESASEAQPVAIYPDKELLKATWQRTQELVTKMFTAVSEEAPAAVTPSGSPKRSLQGSVDTHASPPKRSRKENKQL